jgi:phage gp36-like protein
MFLAKADLKLKILDEELAEITRGDDTLISTALSAAESEMRGWLYDTFDVDTVFAQTGTNRHPLLLDFGADIAVYLLVARLQAGQDVGDRQARYDRAVAWLKASAKTDLYNDLPRREATSQTHISYGSLPKRSNRF